MKKNLSKNIQMIQLISEGMTANEMAPIMGLTERGCNTYRHRLIHRFGAKNSANLVSLAYKNGILKP